MKPIAWLVLATLVGIPAWPSPANGEKSDSEQELQDSLSSIPEVRLFTDEQIQDDLDRKYLKKYAQSVKEKDQPEVVYAHNLLVHQSMVAAGLRQGLPLQTKGSLLPTFDAAVMQTLSRELRELGFVSGTVAKTSASERAKAFHQWCAGNRVEKFQGVARTLEQMLQVEDEPIRLELVIQLKKIKSAQAGGLLAKRALYDLSPTVRRAAIEALQKRPEKEYLPHFLKALRYPWPVVADRASEALVFLKPPASVEPMQKMLDLPDPRAPVRDLKSKALMVPELVRVNHLRNCLLCHVPSAHVGDGLTRGSIPPAPLIASRKHAKDANEDEALERYRRLEQVYPNADKKEAYYQLANGDFVRADVTLLRQDFSAMLRVKKAAPWPEMQRFDFLVRQRRAKPEEIALFSKENDYPQRQAVLRALRGVTEKSLLGIPTKDCP